MGPFHKKGGALAHGSVGIEGSGARANTTTCVTPPYILHVFHGVMHVVNKGYTFICMYFIASKQDNTQKYRIVLKFLRVFSFANFESFVKLFDQNCRQPWFGI